MTEVKIDTQRREKDALSRAGFDAAVLQPGFQGIPEAAETVTSGNRASPSGC